MTSCFNIDDLVKPENQDPDYSELFVSELENDLNDASDAVKVGVYQDTLGKGVNPYLPSTTATEKNALSDDLIASTDTELQASKSADQTVEEVSADIPFGEAIGFAVGAVDIYTRSQTSSLTAAAVAADVTGLFPFVGPFLQAGFGTWDLLQRHDKNVEDYISLWVPAYAVVRTWVQVWSDLNPDGAFVNDAKQMYNTAKNLPTTTLKTVVTERKKAYEKQAQLFINHASNMQEDRLNRSLTIVPVRVLDRLLSLPFTHFRQTLDVSPAAKVLSRLSTVFNAIDHLKDPTDSQSLNDLIRVSGVFDALLETLPAVALNGLQTELSDISDALLTKTLTLIDPSLPYPKETPKVADPVTPGQFSLKKNAIPSDHTFYPFFTQREGSLAYYLAELWQSYTDGAPERDLLAQLRRTTRSQAPLLGKEFVNEMKIMKTGVITRIAQLVASEDQVFATELFDEAKALKKNDLKGLASQTIASMITPGGIYSFLIKNNTNIKDIKAIVGIGKRILKFGNINTIKKQLDEVYDAVIKTAKTDIIGYAFNPNPAPNVLNHVKPDKHDAVIQARYFFTLFNQGLKAIDTYLLDDSIEETVDLSSSITSAIVSRFPVIAPTVPQSELDWHNQKDLSANQLFQPVYVYDLVVKDGSIQGIPITQLLLSRLCAKPLGCPVEVGDFLIEDFYPIIDYPIDSESKHPNSLARAVNISAINTIIEGNLLSELGVHPDANERFPLADSLRVPDYTNYLNWFKTTPTANRPNKTVGYDLIHEEENSFLFSKAPPADIGGQGGLLFFGTGPNKTIKDTFWPDIASAYTEKDDHSSNYHYLVEFYDHDDNPIGVFKDNSNWALIVDVYKRGYSGGGYSPREEGFEAYLNGAVIINKQPHDEFNTRYLTYNEAGITAVIDNQPTTVKDQGLSSAIFYHRLRAPSPALTIHPGQKDGSTGAALLTTFKIKVRKITWYLDDKTHATLKMNAKENRFLADSTEQKNSLTYKYANKHYDKDSQTWRVRFVASDRILSGNRIDIQAARAIGRHNIYVANTSKKAKDLPVYDLGARYPIEFFPPWGRNIGQFDILNLPEYTYLEVDATFDIDQATTYLLEPLKKEKGRLSFLSKDSPLTNRLTATKVDGFSRLSQQDFLAVFMAADAQPTATQPYGHIPVKVAPIPAIDASLSKQLIVDLLGVYSQKNQYSYASFTSITQLMVSSLKKYQTYHELVQRLKTDPTIATLQHAVQTTAKETAKKNSTSYLKQVSRFAPSFAPDISRISIYRPFLLGDESQVIRHVVAEGLNAMISKIADPKTGYTAQVVPADEKAKAMFKQARFGDLVKVALKTDKEAKIFGKDQSHPDKFTDSTIITGIGDKDNSQLLLSPIASSLQTDAIAVTISFVKLTRTARWKHL